MHYQRNSETLEMQKTRKEKKRHELKKKLMQVNEKNIYILHEKLNFALENVTTYSGLGRAIIIIIT